jgi:hypothetical protein
LLKFAQSLPIQDDSDLFLEREIVRDALFEGSFDPLPDHQEKSVMASLMEIHSQTILCQPGEQIKCFLMGASSLRSHKIQI